MISRKGGDGGVTRRVVRRACNLEPERDHTVGTQGPHAVDTSHAEGPERLAATHTGAGLDVQAAPPCVAMSSAGHRLPTPQTAAPPPLTGRLTPRVMFESAESRSIPALLRSDNEALLALHVALVKHCLTSRRDVITADQVVKMPKEVWPSVARGLKASKFRELISHRFWRVLPSREKMTEPCVPIIKCIRGLFDVFTMPPNLVYGGPGRESIDTATMAVLMADTWRMENDAVVQSYLDHEVAVHEKAGAGRMSTHQRQVSYEAKKAAQSFKSEPDSMLYLAGEMQDWNRPMSDVASSPQGSCAFVDRFCLYELAQMGRRYVSTGGVQSCNTRVRSVLLSGVVDLDIETTP